MANSPDLSPNLAITMSLLYCRSPGRDPRAHSVKPFFDVLLFWLLAFGFWLLSVFWFSLYTDVAKHQLCFSPVIIAHPHYLSSKISTT